MEMEKEEYFPWIKDVVRSLAQSLMTDYDREILFTLHGNIEKEIKVIYSSNHHDHTVARAEALFKEIMHLYNHMRLKISQHPDFQNVTLSCVRLISQLIKVGLILEHGLTNSEWIGRILTAMELFPGEKILLYDALLLVNGLKKIHHKPYSAILRNILIKDQHDLVTDPLVYMEIILLFRRLKALVLKKYKEKYTIFVTKIKPPSNLVSWLASLNIDGYSSYLKNFQYKKIAVQLMTKKLPESFLKKIRYMVLNPYNFKIDDSEFKITVTDKQPSDAFVIDNISSTKFDNLDTFVNSQKIVTKKIKSKTKRRIKKLLNKKILNDKDSQSHIEDKLTSEFSKDIADRKHLPNCKKHIIVSKKKMKSKHNLIKIPKSRASLDSSKNVSENAVVVNDVEGCSILPELNKNPKDSDSKSESKISSVYNNQSNTDITGHKHLPNLNEVIVVSKKKQKSTFKLVKNTESETSAIVGNAVSEGALCPSDVESSSTSNKLKTVDDVSNSSISLKKRFSEDMDVNTSCLKEDLTKKDAKKLKLSNYNETKISTNSVSSDNEINSNIVYYQPLVSEKKRKKVTLKEDSASSDDKCKYFKKLMLQKVDNETEVSSSDALNQQEHVKPCIVIEDNSELSNSEIKNVRRDFIENTVHESLLEFIQHQHSENQKDEGLIVEKNSICSIVNANDNEECNKKIDENLNLESEKQKNLIEDGKSNIPLDINDMSITSVSDEKYEKKSNLEKHKENLKSNQITNKESMISENLSVKNVSENVAISSKGLNVTDGVNKDLCNSKAAFNTSDSAHMPSTSDSNSNKDQQFLAIGDENQNISFTSNNILDSVETKDRLGNNTNKNGVNIKHSAENSSNIKSKSEFGEFSPNNSASNMSLKNADLTFDEDKIIPKDNDKISETIPPNNIQSNIEKCVDVDSDIVKNSKYCKDETLFDQPKHTCSDNVEKVEEIHVLTEDVCETSKSSNNVSKGSVNAKDILPLKDNSTPDMLTSSKISDLQTENCKDLCIKTTYQILNDIENEREESEVTVSNLENVNNEKIEETSLKIQNSFEHKDLDITESEFNKTGDTLFPKNSCASEISSSRTLDLEIEESQILETAVGDKDKHNETLPELKKAENANQKCEKGKVEPNEHIENNLKHLDISLANQEKTFEKKDVQSLDKLNDDKTPSNVLANETHVYKNDEFIKSNLVHHDSSEDPIERCPTDPPQQNELDSFCDIVIEANKENNPSDESILTSNKTTCLDSKNNSVNTPSDMVIPAEDNNRDLSNENISSSNEPVCLDNIKNLVLNDKICSKVKEDTLQSLVKPGKLMDDSSKNSDESNAVNSAVDIVIGTENKRNSSNENILSSSVSANLDSIKNSVSDIETFIKEKKDTLKSLFESKKVGSGCENSDPFKDSNSGDNVTIGKENSEKSLSSEKLFPNNTTYLNSSPANDSKISTKEKEDSLQLSLDCKNIVQSLLSNIESSSFMEKAIEIDSTKKFSNNDSTSNSLSEEQCDISFSNNNFKQLSEKDNYQNKPVIKEDVSEVSLENSINKIGNKNSVNNPTRSSLEKNEIAPDSKLTDIKKDLLSIAEEVECSLKDSILKRRLTSEVSLKNDSSSSTKSSKQFDISEHNTKKNPSESMLVPSFCSNYNHESFSEISRKNKNKNIDVNFVGSVSINNFSSAASTELFSMYRNELKHDEYKTDASLSSRDDVLSKCQDIDEAHSQGFSSYHSDEDIDSRYSSEEENEVVPSEDCNTHSININECVSSENSVLSPVETANDSLHDQNCSQDKNISDTSISCNTNITQENKSIKSALPRQSLRLKSKTETKCQTDSEEHSASGTTKALEASEKDPKVVLIDFKSISKSENESNNLHSFVENESSRSLTLENEKDIISSQTPVIKKNPSAIERKSQENSVDRSRSDKRYSLRHRKSNKSRDDSATLDIDLNKLKFDLPSSKCTRSRQSKFVKLLTSDVKLQVDSSSDVVPIKRETRSSTAKSDAGTGSDTPSYNLRNRKSIIAPPKLKI